MTSKRKWKILFFRKIEFWIRCIFFFFLFTFQNWVIILLDLVYLHFSHCHMIISFFFLLLVILSLQPFFPIAIFYFLSFTPLFVILLFPMLFFSLNFKHMLIICPFSQISLQYAFDGLLVPLLLIVLGRAGLPRQVQEAGKSRESRKVRRWKKKNL